MRADLDGYSFNIVLIGDSNVGKSSILAKLEYQDFDEAESSSTNKTVSMTKEASTGINKYRMILWDTPGNETDESFKENTANVYKEADVFMLCFDVTNKESFDNIENNWIKKINEYNTDCKLLLVGIKSDLEDKRVVTYEEARQFVESNDKISSYQDVINKGYNDEFRFIDLVASILMERYFVFLKTYNDRLSVRVNSINQLIESIKSYKGDDKEKQRLLNHLYLQIKNKKVTLHIEGEQEEYNESDAKDIDIIDYIFDRISIIHCTGYAKQSLFDRLHQSLINNTNINRCEINYHNKPYKPYQDKLTRDYRIFAMVIGSVTHCEMSLDTKFLDNCISNTYSFKLWDKFSTNLTNNVGI